MKKEIQKRKKIFVIAGIPATVIVIVFILAAVYYRSDKTIALLDGQAITVDELEFYETLEESSVRNYYRANFGITLESEEMWSQQVDGTEPRQLLAERALERCVNDKALLLLTLEQGIDVPVNYEQFKQAVKEENNEREKALKNKEVVYGVNHFSDEEYLSHTLTNIRNQLITELSREEEQPLYVTDEEVCMYYKANNKDWNAKATTTHVADIMLTNPLTEEDAGKITELIRSGKSLEEIAFAYPDGLETKNRVFTGDSYKTDIRACYEVRIAADEMVQGEVRIITSDEVINVIYIQERISDDEEILNTYSTQIRSVIAEQKFENFLNSYQEQLSYELIEKRFIKFCQR